MNGKKARRLRKTYGVKHARHAVKIERSAANLEELKRRAKKRKQAREAADER